MGKAIEFEYLYRDAGNYKLFDSVILSNQFELGIEQIRELVKASLIDGCWFDPIACGIPQLSFENFDEDLDHDWHELRAMSSTDSPNTIDLDISDFLTRSYSAHHTI